MEYAQRISSLVLSLRKREKIRVRQPLQKILLPILDTNFIAQVDSVKELILAEVNVKELEYITDASGVVKKSMKPNFQTLGRKLGKDMKEAQQRILDLNQDQINHIEKSGEYTLTIGEASYMLTLEDFVIQSEDIPGWLVASDRGLTVALDIQIDEKLEAEGLAREIVNRVQQLRKKADFEVTDRIVVYLSEHAALQNSLLWYSDYICAETLANAIKVGQHIGSMEQHELVEGVEVGIGVELD
jgi:isoleucyl-tRNA synthetase